MEIWIVEEGEKRGPFETYQIRDRIEAGKLSGDELAWHKDQSDWVKLREMDAFRSEFGESWEELHRVLPPPLPSEPFPFLRFFARWFDVSLYLLLVFSLMRFTGHNLFEAVFEAAGCSFLYLYFLPFVFLEAAILHLTKTTPGKFLLGLRVVTPEERALSLQGALVRSLRAYIVGLGLMVHPFLTGICHVYCIWYLMRFNEAPWDTVMKTRVRVVGPLFLPVLLFTVFFIVILVLLVLVLKPTFIQMLEMVRELAA
jgi:uncharacterized RDD family membrane protein YckC